MAEQRRQQVRRKKKPKLRKGRVFFVLLLLVLVVLGGYFYFQYKAGHNLASNGDEEQIEFKGDPSINNVENILLIGIDTRGEEQSRSDTMMLVSVDKDANKVRMVSFMRDIYAAIPGYQSYKLNTAYYLGGVSLLQETLTNMFGVNINHYAIIDFKNFEQLVDVAAPNGVEVTVPHDMSKNIGVSLKKGTQRLNGKELLGFSRFRYDEEGDFGRVERQQQALEALKNEVLSASNVKNYPKLIGALEGYIQTDLTTSQQVGIMFNAVKGGGLDIERMTVPTKDTYQYATYPQAGSVLQIDVEKNRELLTNFLNGSGTEATSP
ncbi:LCP family protein [Kurthia massiliensis]|uniref:LCP family protein n=1 Tax=Kurthia massiliensis TaxID=1033739 RepID=UPI000288812E|nr:LCP family protein [Kurthia massiliensis]